jgi:hypothetical protein
MSTIRTGLPASLPQPASQPAARAASADFFRAALATVQGTSVKPETTASRTESGASFKPGADGRSLRPGSLLDIRV